MSNKIVAGMKVRVSRAGGEGWAHGIKFGAIATVQEVFHLTGEVSVRGPLINDEWTRTQYIDINSIKLAKQANRKG